MQVVRTPIVDSIRSVTTFGYPAFHGGPLKGWSEKSMEPEARRMSERKSKDYLVVSNNR